MRQKRLYRLVLTKNFDALSRGKNQVSIKVYDTDTLAALPRTLSPLCDCLAVLPCFFFCGEKKIRKSHTVPGIIFPAPALSYAYTNKFIAIPNLAVIVQWNRRIAPGIMRASNYSWTNYSNYIELQSKMSSSKKIGL